MIFHLKIYIDSEYNKSLAENTKQPSPITPQIISWQLNPAIILMLLKLRSKWIWGLLDFWKWLSIKQ